MAEIAFRKPSINIPAYLYKYYSNTEYALDAIKNGRIHLEMPDTYNDVFDSALVILENQMDLISYNDSLIEQIVYFTHRDYKKAVKEISIYDFRKCKNLLQIFELLAKKGIPQEIISSCKSELLKRVSNIQPQNNKISCFSEIPNSELMWAHYGNHLSGVCLVFETSRDEALSQKLFKMNYTPYRVVPQIGSYDFYFTKSLEWSYEQEWRMVVETEEDYLSTNACSGIILGSKMSIEDFLKISCIASNCDKKIYKAYPNESKYEIDIIDWYTKNEIQI